MAATTPGRAKPLPPLPRLDLMSVKATPPPLPPRVVLANISLRDVLELQPKGRKLVKLQHSDTIADALTRLAEHNILAAPVMVTPTARQSRDAADSDSDSAAPCETMVGWADVREILKAFVMTHAEKLACVSDPAGWDAALDAVAADFVQRKLVNVTGDDGQLVHSLSSDMSLLSAVTEGFLSTGGCERTLTPRSGGYGPSAGSNGAPSGPPGRRGGVVHRLALFKHGTISSILSQSDCMGYLAQHASLLGPLASASLASLGFVTGREVVCVAPETPTHAAFATMFASHVSAVGVTGPDGTMVANLSASDLRRLQPNNFRVLALPVSDFLASLAAGHSAGSAISLAKAAAAGAVGGANAPVTVSPDSPFLGVLELLGSQKPRVHRVYLCEKGVPVGVITATDVLRMLADKEAGRDTAVP